MEQAPIAPKIIGAAFKSGRALPDKLANPPSLAPGLEMYYNAFWELSTCRQVGISLGPIPWNVIQYYGREKDYSEEQIEALQYHIRRMDGEYIKFLEKKNKGTK